MSVVLSLEKIFEVHIKKVKKMMDCKHYKKKKSCFFVLNQPNHKYFKLGVSTLVKFSLYVI